MEYARVESLVMTKVVLLVTLKAKMSVELTVDH